MPGQDLPRLAGDPALRQVLRELPRRRPGRALQRRWPAEGVDKFAGVEWAPAPATGSPIIDGSLGYVDCTIHTVHEAGDHYVVIGRVLDLAVRDGAETPLLFFEGKYSTTEGKGL